MVQLALLILNFRTGLVLARPLKELLCLILRRAASGQNLKKCIENSMEDVHNDVTSGLLMLLVV